MRKILTLMVVTALAVALAVPANAAWKIGGTGPFITFPFYVDGSYDGVTLKTYLVVNNVDTTTSTPIISLIHYPDASLATNGGYTSAANLSDLRTNAFASDSIIYNDNLTRQQSAVLDIGKTLGPVTTGMRDYKNPAFILGWVETWAYNASTGAVNSLGRLRGESITVDFTNRTAFNYKAVASTPYKVTDDPTLADATPNVTSGSNVFYSSVGSQNVPDVLWSPAGGGGNRWHTIYDIPVAYQNLADRYMVDFWVKSSTNLQNNTNIIITNPNHRKFGASICRDNTAVNVDTFNSQENSSHAVFQVGEMRLISFALDIPNGALNTGAWYGGAFISENDTVATVGLSAAGNLAGSNAGAACNVKVNDAATGISDALVAGYKRATTYSNTTNSGFMAVAFTSWAVDGGRTWWGSNLFNNCGDAFTYRDINAVVPTVGWLATAVRGCE